jgi:hypothetical protein
MDRGVVRSQGASSSAEASRALGAGRAAGTDPVSARRPWVGLVVAVGVMVAMLWALVPATRAATAVNSFALPAGQFPFGPNTGNTNGFSDIALDTSNGNIFFGEPIFGRVAIYTPDPFSGGNFLTNFDAYTPSAMAGQNVAVDSSDGTVYINNDPNIGPPTAVAKFTSDGAPTPTYTYDSTFSALFGQPNGMAVDPTTHDLLVADATAGFVFRFSSSGTLLSSFNGGGTLTAPVAVAVGPSGAFYVVDSASNTVQRYSAGGTAQGALALTGSQPSAITANQTTGEVAVFTVLNGQGQVEVFTAGGTPEFVAPVPTIPAAHGLAWDATSDRLYVSIGGGLANFLVRAIQPGVDAPVVDSSGRDTAHVHAVVAPGGEPTTAWLEYCPATANCAGFAGAPDPNAPTPNDAHNPWKRGPDHSVSSNGQETIADDLPLRSNTQWRIRVAAVNSQISIRSAITTFTSPLLAPAVETGPAGSVTDSQAVLSGTIDTLGDQTTYHFEYGLTTNYGSRVPAGADAAAGNNRLPRTVSKTITGLQSGTVYHYRLVATNSAGTGVSADRTFKTAGPDEVAPRRAYEQVTPTNKRGALINSDFHAQTAPDGSAISVVTASGSSDSQTVNIRQNYRIHRGADDWLDWTPVDAPQGALGGIFEASTAALSADFDHALVISNRALTPGAFAGGGNLYIKDLRTGAYTFVGGAPGVLAYQAFTSPGAGESIYITGASDFSWIKFYSFWSLKPGVPNLAVYRWSRSDGLSVESLNPDNTIPTELVQTSPGAVPDWQTTSADGSILYFAKDLGGGPGPLYRRANGQTTLISHSDGSDPSLPASDPVSVTLDGVSSDGRYAVFHVPAWAPLTADTPPGAVGVYRYDAVDDSVHYLTSGDGPSQPIVLAVSKDANTVYLDQNAASGGGPIAVWRNGTVRTVSNGNSAGPASYSAGAPVQNVSPSGRYFAWVESGGTLQLYDADADETVCVSCPNDGSAPGMARTRAPDRAIGNRGPGVVNDDGLVIFDSPAQLTTADHNGSRDVYAYSHGRLTLISPGNDDKDAQFVDASDDGRDIFFQTSQSLVGQDTDGSTDVYDARVGGGFAKQNPPPPPARCVRGECGETGSGPVTSPSAPSQTPQSHKAPKRTNLQKTRVDISKVRFTSKTVKVTFEASQRGRVTVSGSRVTRTIRNVSKAGTYTMTVRLSKSTRSLLRHHKRVKVSLRISLYGGWSSDSDKYSRTLGK